MCGKLYHLDIDFEIGKSIPKTFVNSKLSHPVQELMKIILDIRHMNKMVLSCEMDLKRMPLGKISTRQIHVAMQVLERISKLINQNGSFDELRNASNEFFTLIPHGFSIKRPPIIDSINVVKAKSELLESLLNMDVIYGFLEGKNGEKINPFDACYEKIKTDINVLSKNAPEFIKIVEIVRDTHGATHNLYTLEVLDVFKIKRKREDVRSKKYTKIENHQMLWHGSRITNFISILTKGLRIAPKGVPITDNGYFGKGVYFADMVSKSANYCHTDQINNIGLLLLCDVALGKSRHPDYIQRFSDLPNENEQSVHALGATYPSKFSTLDGIKIASGGLRKADYPTSLKYNEYVVYDIDQVKMKYLVKVKFNYK